MTDVTSGGPESGPSRDDLSSIPGCKPSQRLLTLAEVAELFGRSRRTVRLWIAQRRLPVVHIGRAPFVPAAALDGLVTAAINDWKKNVRKNNALDGNNE